VNEELIKELKEYLRWSGTQEAQKLSVKLDAELTKVRLRVLAYSDEVTGIQADAMFNPVHASNATLVLDEGVEL
jgi:hypothetical protein